MARKIFVSYKHSDKSVEPLGRQNASTARDYVDKLGEILEGDHIYKGEKDDEDLGKFKDETIKSHLRDKIFDSSVTIVLISKNMKEPNENEEDQWIPWEISYSLKEKKRGDRTSTTNAMLAVALPDERGGYDYVVSISKCTGCLNTRIWKTNALFTILRKNMFNRKRPKISICKNPSCNGQVHSSNDHSYIYPLKWEEFVRDMDVQNVNQYIDLATSISENINDYEVAKEV